MSAAFGPRAVLLTGLAAQRLGWRPAEFWTATPAELRQALGEAAGEPAGIDRATLVQLMGRDTDGR